MHFYVRGNSRSRRVFEKLRPRVPLYAALYFRLPFVVFEAPAWPLAPDVAVVDIETTGLDPSRDRMLTLGLYKGDRVTIYQLLFGEDLRRYREVWRELEALRGLRVHAWYRDFEESWLGVRGLHEIQTREYEKKDDSVRIEGLEPRFTGRDVPSLWEAWRRTGDVCCVLAIVERNYLDLLTEAAALVRFPLFEPRAEAEEGEEAWVGEDWEDEDWA